MVGGESEDLVQLGLRALTVVGFAILYITLGVPVSGIKSITKNREVTFEEADKAFHDTAVGQSMGVTLTPFIKKLFETVCLLGRSLEIYLWPPVNADAAKQAALEQDWELAAGFVYVVLVVTPLTIWLYLTVVLGPNEKKFEGQNAAAAADEGGDDGLVDGDDFGGGGDVVPS